MMTLHTSTLSPRRLVAMGLGLTVLFSAQSGWAKDSPATSTPYAGVTGGGSNQDGERTGGSGYEQLDSSAQISSEGDQINADFSLDYRIAGSPKLDGNQLVGSHLSISIKGSVPLNGTEPDSVIDFKTFGTGGNLTLGFNYFRPRVISSQESYPVIRQLARYCVATTADKWLATPQAGPTGEAKVQEALGRFNQAAKDSELGIFEVIDLTVNAENANGSLGKAISDGCSKDNPKLTDNISFIAVFSASALTPSEAATWGRSVRGEGTLYLGGQVSIGYNRFSIIDRATFTTPVVDRIGYDASGRVGYIFGGTNVMVIGNFGYTRSFKPQAEAEVCGPPAGNGQSECKKGQDGPPVMSETGYAGATMRWVVARNSLGEPTVGIRPSATYIFEDKDWQFELPIHFQRNSTGGLDAGVRGIYNTGSRDFGIGAFVGLNF